MPGLLRGVARTAAVVGTAATVSGRVNRRQQKKYAAEDAQAASADDTQSEAAAPSADMTDDQFAQLEKLGELRDKGILTQSEFDQKKTQILGL